MFEKYGGQETVDAVVEAFYVKNLSDTRIKHIFEGVNMTKLKAHQKRFVALALGGPNRYTGRTMKKAHEGLSLTSAHFDAVVENLAAALTEGGVSEEDVKTVAGVLEPMRADVVSA